MLNRSLTILVSLTLMLVVVKGRAALATDHFDTDNEPNQMVEPSSDLKPWFSKSETHLASVLKRESKLAAGIKVPVICIFCINADGQISRLTFKTTSGSQDNDTCALEIVRRAVPFDLVPPTVQAPKRVAAQIGMSSVRMWQLP